jgi:hypothetical protein
MLDESCPECNRLWREYASATAEHLKLTGQMGLALYDSGLYQIAKLATEIAEQHQEAVRVKMEEHKTLRHRSVAAASTNI